MGEHPTRVLVVDDERFFREAICEALRDADVPCDEAGDAESAIATARSPEVGVVVLDLSLPGAAGIEVLSSLLVERPALRVLVLSSHTEQDLVLEALRAGASDYLAKPLHDEELVLAVRRAIASYGVESSWDALRLRLGALEDRIRQLVESAETEKDDAAFGREVTEALGHVLGATKTSLMVVDDDRETLRVLAATGRELLPDEMDAVKLGDGIAGRVLAGGDPLLSVNATTDDRFAGRGVSERYASGACVLAPLSSGGRPLGVLCAADRSDAGAFGCEDLSLLRILAWQVGSLLAARAVLRIEPAPLPDEITEHHRVPSADDGSTEFSDPDARLARAICDAVTSEIDPDDLLRAALREVAEHVCAAPVSLYLVDTRGGRLVLEGQCEGAGHADRPSLPVGAGLTGTVLHSGRLVATDAPDRDARFDAEVDTPEGGDPGPLLCVPVRVRGKTLGVVRAFLEPGSTASARTGEILASTISAAVRNVLMYRSLLESVDEVARVRRENPRSPQPRPA